MLSEPTFIEKPCFRALKLMKTAPLSASSGLLLSELGLEGGQEPCLLLQPVGPRFRDLIRAHLSIRASSLNANDRCDFTIIAVVFNGFQ